MFAAHFFRGPVVSPLPEDIDTPPRIQSGDVLLIEAFKETCLGGVGFQRWYMLQGCRLQCSDVEDEICHTKVNFPYSPNKTLA